jgi:formylglycine-generating enzyme required for sulfatase activity/serine/threonine protein kinase
VSKKGSMSLRAPDIPDHDLIRSIGRGAYGEIWLAKTLTGGFRAIKVVFPEPELAYREFDGIRAFEPISRHHPGFVNIYHVGRGDKFLYYTMELADDCHKGQKIDPAIYAPHTLATDLRDSKRLSPETCLELGKTLSGALGYLHEQGLTHRDIKPSNVIFVNGAPKLADVGLVAAAGRKTYVGTEGYVPPEGPGSPSADVYALGKVLYEAATGKDRLEFPEIPTDLPQLSNKEILLRLNSVLLKACAREPRQRFQNGRELQEALAAIEATPKPAKRRWFLPALLGSAGLIVAAAVGFIGSTHLWFGNAPKAELISPSPPSSATPASTPKTGSVRIETNPSGAQVWDGEHELGTTPLELNAVAAGDVHYQLRLPHYLYADVTGTVETGDALTLQADLQIAKAPVSGQSWTNTIGMKFVPVGDLLIDIWDTRVRDFAQFVRETGYQPTGPMESILNGEQGQHGKTWDDPGFTQTDDYPVVGVSWKDAMEFCSWLTQKEQGTGLLQEGQYYRLPTDVEWSQAAGLAHEDGDTPEDRSNKGPEAFLWGKTWPPPAASGNYAGAEMKGADWPLNWRWIQGYSDAFTRTSPVGFFKPNLFGIYDLSGNVWQWCMDKFSRNGDTRVLRGGSWANADPGLLRLSRRIDDIVDSRTDCYGFRCVLQTPAFGVVTLSSDPTGAEVSLNGKTMGRTPLVLENVTPGPLKIELRLAGYRTGLVNTKLEARENLDLPLVKLEASNWPDGKTRWINSLGMSFVPVGDILASVWDTRVSDFRAFCRATGRGMVVPDFEQGADHPAVLINRPDAEAFCDWLTEKERLQGLIGSKTKYRLPTDREWSRFAGLPDEQGQSPAARDSKDQKHYPWGEIWPPPSDAGNFGNPSDSKQIKRRFPQTSPVGNYAPNSFGLYDVAGNVWQWCLDPYGGSGTFSSWGVLRGGSWGTYGVRLLLSSYRDVVSPLDRDVTYGFRCVLEVSDGKGEK